MGVQRLPPLRLFPSAWKSPLRVRSQGLGFFGFRRSLIADTFLGFVLGLGERFRINIDGGVLC